MPRIRYSDEVRAEILRRVGSGEVSHAQAAREVGCSLSTIQNRLCNDDPATTTPSVKSRRILGVVSN